MKDTQTVYIGIDLHSNTSTIGYMNEQGEYCGHRQVETTPVNLINQIAAEDFACLFLQNELKKDQFFETYLG